MKSHRRLLTLGLALAVCLPGIATAAESVPNFNLVDLQDRDHELYRAHGKAVVLFFTGVGCPIARKGSLELKRLKEEFEMQGITFWIINSYAGETASEAREEIKELKLNHFPYMLDRKQAVSLAFGVKRTAEVVAIETTNWGVFYRGAIDDRFAEGAEKPAAASTPHLKNALQQFLADEPIANRQTRTRGCRISYAKITPEGSTPDYATQVAPILQAN